MTVPLTFFRQRIFKPISIFSSLAVWFASVVLCPCDCGSVKDTAVILTLFSSKHQLKTFNKILHTVFYKIGTPLLFK